MEAMQSEANSVAADELESQAPSARRLVIRIIFPKDSLEAAPPRRMSRGALLLIAAPLAVVLSWVGVTLFRAEPASPRAVTAPALAEARPAASGALPQPSTRAAAPSTAVELRSNEAKSVESQAVQQPDASPMPVNQVVPDVPQSALDTIRGTVRVSVRVTIDKSGGVVSVAADEPGPSRYFERLSLQASKKWTFSPAPTQEGRVMLLKFNYTRAGVTAQALCAGESGAVKCP